MTAYFIEQIILELNHEVIASVKSAKEALEVVKKESPHIVFMDINLAGSMDGIACAKAINEIKKLPIIYMTAYSDSQTISEATQTNLYGYLIKPFTAQDIEVTLNITIKLNYVYANTKTDKTDFFNLNNNYQYYALTKTLNQNNINIQLTKKESSIFHCLFINLNQTVSISLLSHSVWGNKTVASSTIRDTILRLRKKIPQLNIKTHIGMGYSLEFSS